MSRTTEVNRTARVNVDFAIEDTVLKGKNVPIIYAKSQNYFYATFHLGSIWAAVEGKKVIFERDDKAYAVVLTELNPYYGECLIPWEILESHGRFSVGLTGGDRLLTNTVWVDVAYGCAAEGEVSKAPTEDWFVKTERKVDEVYNAYKNGDFEGDPFTYEDFTPEQLEALKVKGDKGDTGKSAYDIAKEGGYEGTEEAFTNDLLAVQGLAEELEGLL